MAAGLNIGVHGACNYVTRSANKGYFKVSDLKPDNLSCFDEIAKRLQWRTFCGVELDIILGHPEHDVLFFAKQALESAGLNVATGVAHRAKAGGSQYLQVKELASYANFACLGFLAKRNQWKNIAAVWLATEAGLLKWTPVSRQILI